MTHKDGFAHLMSDLAEVRPLKDFELMHAHAVRLLEGPFPHYAVTQMIAHDHGVKPQVASVIVAAALAAIEHPDGVKT